MKSVIFLLVSILGAQSGLVGDVPVYEGHLSRVAEAFEFRPCDTDNLYLIDARFPFTDTLDRLFESQTPVTTNTIYIRIHAEVVENVSGLPARYAAVARILELLSSSDGVPVDCK